MEIWKQIPGYEGYYSASNLGRIRRDMAEDNTYAGRILSPSTKGRYARLGLTKNGFVKAHNVHKLVMSAFHGDPEKGYVVNHKNLNHFDNKLKNLEYVTYSENNLHALRNGAWGGSKQYNAKLNETQVLDIRKRYSQGNISQQKLADEYCVSQVLISVVILRKRWKYI